MSRASAVDVPRRITQKGWYRGVVPFGREVPPEQQEDISTAISQIPIRHDQLRSRSTEYFAPDRIDVDEEGATVEFALGRDADYTPADVLGRVSRSIHEWDREHPDPTVNTPAGGEQYLTSISPPHLNIDEEPVTDDPDVRQYIIATPKRRFTEREAKALRAAGGDDVHVERGFIVVFGHTEPFIVDPKGMRRLKDIAESSPMPRLDDYDELADWRFWPMRELGTLPADTDTVREAVVEHARDFTPYTDAESETADEQAHI